MNRDGIIRAIAYRLWQEAGQPDGGDLHFWLLAEAQYSLQNGPWRSRPQD